MFYWCMSHDWNVRSCETQVFQHMLNKSGKSVTMQACCGGVGVPLEVECGVKEKGCGCRVGK